MQQILQAIKDLDFAAVESGGVDVAAGSVAHLSAINPSDLCLSVGDGAVVDLVLAHDGASDASISVSLGVGSTLRLTELFAGSGTAAVSVEHAQGATSKIVALSLSCSHATYDLNLSAAEAYSSVDSLQLGSQKDKNSLKLNMRHMSADCSSRSLSKCVASGESELVFDGLVYVAQDAQRTSAEQNCRSLALSDMAHITAHPQLEIYADDVKCSHGATMGQMDNDAILYMRQRGLSEAQARRVQIEGFVTDVVDKCEVEELRDALKTLITHKLEEM